MRRAFKYKAPLSRQERLAANRQLALCCELYNAALEERRELYAYTGRSVTRNDQMKRLTGLKKVRPDLATVGSQVLQQVLDRVHLAFQSFFLRVARGEKPGYPRFKSLSQYTSLTFKQAGWALGSLSASGKRRALALHGIGTIRLFWSRDLGGVVKTVTLKRDACGDWWVVFSCDGVPESPLPPTGLRAGFDAGLEAYLTDQTGVKTANPRPFKSAMPGLRHAQRSLAKKKRGGARRRKAVRRVAVHHRTVERVRRDFHHKLALQLVRLFDDIAMEDLNILGMARGMLARSVHDAGWGVFHEILRAKAESAGRRLFLVDPRNTSQMCSQCLDIPEVKKTLRDRLHHCLECGYIADRDHNAAENIYALMMELISGITRAGQAPQRAEAQSGPALT